MSFLLQDCSFDSLGISSVAVYLVDTGNDVLAVFISLSDQKCAPVLLFCFPPLNSLSNLKYMLNKL